MGDNLEKICALICAFNEEKTVGQIVHESKQYAHDVIVVDDGSTDKTAEFSEKNGAIVLRHKLNKGKGAALKLGFNHFLGKDYDAIVTLDADGQHLPNEIPFLVNKLREGHDMVIGKRDFRGDNVPFTRKVANLFDSYILSKMLGESVYDAQSGFRAFRKDAASKVYDMMVNEGYTCEPELVSKLIRKKFKIGWTDISTVYIKGRESKIKPFRHTVDSFKLYVKCFRER